MLDHAGVDYKRRDLISFAHRGIVRALGFPAATVPALRRDRRRVQGTRAIAREVGLAPDDPERQEIERWGDEVLQPLPRRISWWAIRRHPAAARSFLEGARLGIPVGIAARTVRPIAWASARANRADDAAVRADLDALPGLLDRVDGWIGDGLLDAAAPTSADFQVAASVRLLQCFDDLAPTLVDRPAAEHARRVIGAFPGHVPSGILPVS